MALAFACESCSAELKMKYVKRGEIAKCPHCHSHTKVPEDAKEIDAVLISSELPRPSPRPAIPNAQNQSSECYICGAAIPRWPPLHYCKPCQQTFPEFMRDNIRHVHTKTIALSVFNPGGPIKSAEAYCERNVPISDIASCLPHYPLVGILGERGAGKTSALMTLLALLRGDEAREARYGRLHWPHRAVYINDASTLDDLLRRATQELMHVRPSWSGYRAPFDGEILAELEVLGVKFRGAIRSADQWGIIRSAIESQLGSDSRRCFRLALRLLQLAEQRTVLFIDEAERFPAAELNRLGELIKSCESLNAVFCIGGILDNLDSVCAGHASILRAYREFRLERFDETQVRDLLEGVNRKLVSYVHFDPECIAAIDDWSQGVPAVVQNIGYQTLASTLGGEWYSFAASARANGPNVIGRSEVEITVGRVAEWLSPYYRALCGIMLHDPSGFDVLQRIAGQRDYVLYEHDIPEILAGITEVATVIDRLQRGEASAALRPGRQNRPGMGMANYLTFDDPVLGWLTSTARRLPDLFPASQVIRQTGDVPAL